MSERDLAVACNARLFDGEAIGRMARAWLQRNSAGFLRLKSSEIATMLEAVSQGQTKPSIIARIKEHLESRVKCQKGSSPWGRMAGGSANTMLESLCETIEQCVNQARPLPGDRQGEPNPVEALLKRRLQDEEVETWNRARDCQIAVQFLVSLARIHQSGGVFQEEEERWQKSSAS